MCFDIQVHTKPAVDLSKYYGLPKHVELDFNNQLSFSSNDGVESYYHVSGFERPSVLCINSDFSVQKKQWGLIPHWTKSKLDASNICNKTINARSETAGEKPAYKMPLQGGRCIILVEAYYEHHHSGKNTFPYRFYNPKIEQIALAAISDSWINPESNEPEHTFSILTTSGNKMAKQVHNNPKNKQARMPMILPTPDEVVSYLAMGNETDVLNSLSISAQTAQLKAHSVAKIRGVRASENSPIAITPKLYPELGFFMPTHLP